MLYYLHRLNLIFLLCIPIILTACGGTYNRMSIAPTNETELQQLALRKLTDAERLHFTVPFLLNDKLREIAHQLKDKRLDHFAQAHKIVRFMLDEKEGLGIKYAGRVNYGAIEVYQTRQANCVSFTNLFIGLAREIGLKVNYVQVYTGNNFTSEGSCNVFNSHICACVYTLSEHRLVDFTLNNHPQYPHWRTISDIEALASMYSNRGGIIYLDDQNKESLKTAEHYLGIASKLLPGYVPALNNLGIIALHRGYSGRAKTYFLEALQQEPDYFAANQNLANVLIMENKINEAVQLFENSLRRQPENYRAYICLAKLHVQLNDLSGARKQLEAVLRIRPDFAEAIELQQQIDNLETLTPIEREKLLLARNNFSISTSISNTKRDQY